MRRHRGRRIVASVALVIVLATSALIAWAYWTAPGASTASAPSGSLDAATIGVPPSAADTVTVTWTQQASLQPAWADHSPISYSVERKLGSGSWAAVVGGGCSGAKPHGIANCVDAPAANGSYSYRVLASYHGWTAISNEAGPVAFAWDIVAPANAITLSSITGGAFKSGATVYYRGAAAGSFRLTNTVSDSGPSGPASSATAALSGTSTGWTHSPSLVSTPAGGPYVSSAFSWSAATTSSPGETITGSDAAGNTAATALAFTDDSVAPTGGTVDATGLGGTGGRYSTSTGLSIAFSAGTDAGSGLATGAQLQRAAASLTTGSCGTYGAYTQVGADDPASPVADTVPADQTCYRYRYVVSDQVGNPATTYTSADIKVDTTAPAAPTLAFSALTNTYRGASTLYYRSNATSGAFTVTASATDATSGIVSYAFPTLPSGWSAAAGGLGVNTYSWSVANPTAPSGAQNVTATNNAALTSAGADLGMVSDITAPATGSVTYTNGYFGSASVSVSFARGTDGGSGVDATSGLLQRSESALTSGTCTGGYSAFATITGGTNPTSPFADTTVVTAKCYQYRYLASDNVGNQATYTSANVAQVDLTPPVITRATVAKTATSTAGTVRQGAIYNVYAQVTDATTVPAATANVSSFDTGVTAASLSTASGPWTVGGQSYNFRSANVTANTGLTTGASYSYTISASDSAANTAGPTSYSATIETYNTVITGTSGLVSFWRFNDGAIAGDEFTDTAGTVLSSHTGALGATWTSISGQARTAVITAAGRLRKETGNGAAQYYASATPSSANYLVQADVYGLSGLATDVVSVVGRQDISGAGNTYYQARYVVDSGRWELRKSVAGVFTLIGTGTGAGYYTQALTLNTSYRMTLQMNGTAISLLVDGVSRIAATDSAISATGRGGVRLGANTSTAAVSDSAGLHLDDFRITSLTTTADDGQAASNNGTFVSSPFLNEPGALAGDSNRATRLDGVSDYVTVPDAASLDLANGAVTLEAWVKRSNAAVTSMCLIDKGVGAIQFCLDNNNTVLLRNNVAYISRSTTTVTDTSWHHLVATKTASAAALYIDGVSVTGTVTNQTLVNTTTALLFGVVNPWSSGGYLAGTIDEFALYNAALSAATVLDHYKAGAGTG
ncbi:MAG: LamG-like jellyroll fold domain-containing protein [Solirubrobacteraceae bacterium]